MSTADLLSLIDVEIAKLQQARALLATASAKRPGRPVKPVIVSKEKPKRKRTMSAEGKARIAEAQRKRWAKQKKG
jgi:hypothetical protein